MRLGRSCRLPDGVWHGVRRVKVWSLGKDMGGTVREVWSRARWGRTWVRS